MTWLRDDELRVGLGCMRLVAERAEATVAAALEAGITVFDTAHAYGSSPGANERLVAQLLQGTDARVVTKGGMTRPGGAWVPDGRAAALRADCEASLAALDGKVDLYLLHAPDPRTPWATSVRALAALLDQGLVRRVGLCNVNRAQLDEALDLVEVTAVQNALSPYDDTALRGGVLDRCEELGITLLAHSPLGGPKRAAKVDAEVVVASLLALSPVVVPIPGATRPESARSVARAAAAPTTAVIDLRPRPEAAPTREGEVVLVMGIPGAGKSRLARELADHVRLNRDERGGTLRGIADELDRQLAEGATRVVLDNTYLTRAVRSHVVDVARKHGLPVRCVWLDTPLAQAQVNLVNRLLDVAGRLPTPEEVRVLAKKEAGVMLPGSQMRAARELEPPGDDEGFSEITRLPFERAPGIGTAGVVVMAQALDRDGWEHAVEAAGPPYLLVAWLPDGDGDLADRTRRLEELGEVDVAICRHAAGPPQCWCRPPLPGLVLEHCRRRGVDPARLTVIGTGPAHRTLAAALGSELVLL
jgi:aryl-alcohol dehydrogenase-like predicted oxidoreductase